MRKKFDVIMMFDVIIIMLQGMHINHDDLVALATGTVLCICTAISLLYCW